MTIFILDGGLGRLISSIPALLKYDKNHQEEEWYILINGWHYITWGIPELQNRTFELNTKGVFDLLLRAEKVIKPEPYHVPDYYRNKISLREAWDVVINNSQDHEDLPPMQLVLSNEEKRASYDLINFMKMSQGKEKTIVIQPYGSSANVHASGNFDNSLRSMPELMIDYFIKNLSKEYNIIFMGLKELCKYKNYRPEPDPTIREWMSIINSADYFIGCDSCGQHMRKAFNKKASVFIAGTSRVNTSYDDFHIIEKDLPFYPDGMRLSGFNSMLSERLNEPRFEFDQSEIEMAYKEVVSEIEKCNTHTMTKPELPVKIVKGEVGGAIF